MKKFIDYLKSEAPLLLLIIGEFAIGGFFYSKLPQIVPIHWGMSGQANGYGSRLEGAFLLPLITLGLYILLYLLPFIDPKRENYKNFKSSYQVSKYIMVIFLFCVHVIALMSAMGVKLNMSRIVLLLCSGLFIVMGNMMGRFRHNYFVGVKTPWTLASEEVWRKTHRMAGPVWVVGGLVNIPACLLPVPIGFILFIIITAVISLVPIVYSYLAYRRLNKNA